MPFLCNTPTSGPDGSDPSREFRELVDHALKVATVGAVGFAVLFHAKCDPLDASVRCLFPDREHLHVEQNQSPPPPDSGRSPPSVTVSSSGTASGSMTASTAMAEIGRVLESFTTVRG